jgi:hypothetical protein
VLVLVGVRGPALFAPLLVVQVGATAGVLWCLGRAFARFDVGAPP